MSNRYRDEVSLELGGTRHVLRLSLQALAEIEAAFEVDGLEALGKRFGAGTMRTQDLTCILAALLRGGGGTLADSAVASLIEARDLPNVIAAIGAVFSSAFGEEAGGSAPARP
jgi:hypothetical protein